MFCDNIQVANIHTRKFSICTISVLTRHIVPRNCLAQYSTVGFHSGIPQWVTLWHITSWPVWLGQFIRWSQNILRMEGQRATKFFFAASTCSSEAAVLFNCSCSCSQHRNNSAAEPDKELLKLPMQGYVQAKSVNQWLWRPGKVQQCLSGKRSRVKF